jgi:glycosyltransferase involved in cell wall biosynthesis
MKIGIAGPVTLSMLQELFPDGTKLPPTYSFPLLATFVERLHRRGHEVVVFALSRDVNAPQLFAGNRIQAYVCPQRRPRFQMADFFRGERRALADAMQRSQCDVIHAHWTYEFGAAVVDSGIPHVVTAHDNPLATIRFAVHPYWVERPLLAWKVVPKAKSLTAVSPHVADVLRRYFRPTVDITVIRNGVSPEVFAAHASRVGRAERDTIIFASVSNNWEGLKNGRQLVKAFARLRTILGCKVALWMIGDGHGPGGPAEAWATRRSLQQGIRFLGPLSYPSLIRTLADDVDVFVHPSLEEAHCMAINEAMAIGLPVIAGQHSGGVASGLADGKAGLLVDVRSASSLASGMRTMAENHELRNQYGSAARDLARSQYHIDTVLTQYETVLLEATRLQAQR